MSQVIFGMPAAGGKTKIFGPSRWKEKAVLLQQIKLERDALATLLAEIPKTRS